MKDKILDNLMLWIVLALFCWPEITVVLVISAITVLYRIGPHA